LNLLTPEKVREGVEEIQEGLSFCLSLPLNLPGGTVLNERRGPPQLEPTTKDGHSYINFPLAKVHHAHTDVISDDRAILSLQYSTQWDSLAHVGALFDADDDGHKEKVYYNGFRAEADIRGPVVYTVDGQDEKCEGPYGAMALGIDNFAQKPIQGRAVLVNLVSAYGTDRILIGKQKLLQALERQQAAVRPGDILLLYTGFADAVMAMGGNPIKEKLDHTGPALDGRDPALLEWIANAGVAAIAADNYAVEAFPHPTEVAAGAALPLHEHCLFKLGVPLGELWWLSELAQWLEKNGRSSCLLTAPPLRLPGAFGSPVTPVATV
jgi:kynurenine formamidase